MELKFEHWLGCSRTLICFSVVFLCVLHNRCAAICIFVTWALVPFSLSHFIAKTCMVECCRDWCHGSFQPLQKKSEVVTVLTRLLCLAGFQWFHITEGACLAHGGLLSAFAIYYQCPNTNLSQMYAESCVDFMVWQYFNQFIGFSWGFVDQTTYSILTAIYFKFQNL